MSDNFMKKTKSFFDFLVDVFVGASQQEKHRAYVQREAIKLEDTFMLLCFGDIIGLPAPSPYFVFKLLPQIAGRLPSFIQRTRSYDCIEMLSQWESFI